MKRILKFKFLALISYLILSPILIVAQNTDVSLSGINLVNGVLIPEFNSEITNYLVITPDKEKNVIVTPILNDVNAKFTGGGQINLEDSEQTTIDVISSDGKSNKSYVISFAKKNCYIPIFSDRENLVPNPLMSTLAGYGGWGNKSINTNPSFVYCGKTSAKIIGQNGGSIDFNTATKFLQEGSSYLISAMFYVQGSGKAQIGHSINGPSILTETKLNNQWEEVKVIVDVTNLNKSANIWLNNYRISSSGDNIYIDNFQMYKISNDNTLSDLSCSAGTLVPEFSPENTKYFLQINQNIDQINIVSTPNSKTSLISGDGLININDDNKVIDIVVVAENQTSQIYTINIVNEIPDLDASLSELSVNIGTLKPSFDPEVTYYTLEVPDGTNNV